MIKLKNFIESSEQGKFKNKGNVVFVKKCINRNWNGIYSKDGFLRKDLGRYVPSENFPFTKFDNNKFIADNAFISVAGLGYFSEVNYGDNTIFINHNDVQTRGDLYGFLHFEFWNEFEFKFYIDRIGGTENNCDLFFLFSDKKIKDTSGISYYSIAITEGSNQIYGIIYDNGNANVNEAYINGELKYCGIRRDKENNFEMFYCDSLGEHTLFSSESETGFVVGMAITAYPGSGFTNIRLSYRGGAYIASPFYLLSNWLPFMICEGASHSETASFDYNEVVLVVSSINHISSNLYIYAPDGSTIFSCSCIPPQQYSSFKGADFENGYLTVSFESTLYITYFLIDFANGYSYYITINKTTNRASLHKSIFPNILIAFSTQEEEYGKLKINNRYVTKEIPCECVIDVFGDQFVGVYENEIVTQRSNILCFTSVYGTSIVFKENFVSNDSKYVFVDSHIGKVMLIPDNVKSSNSIVKVDKLSKLYMKGELDPQTQYFTPINQNGNESDFYSQYRYLFLIVFSGNDKFTYKCFITGKVNNKYHINILDGQQLPQTVDEAWLIPSDNENVHPVNEFYDIHCSEGNTIKNYRGLTIKKDWLIADILGSNNDCIFYSFKTARIDGSILNINGIKYNDVNPAEIYNLGYLNFLSPNSFLAIPYPFSLKRLNLNLAIKIKSLRLEPYGKRNILTLRSSIANNSLKICIQNLIDRYCLVSGDDSVYPNGYIILQDNILEGDVISISLSDNHINGQKSYFLSDVQIPDNDLLNHLVFGNDTIDQSLDMLLLFGEMHVSGDELYQFNRDLIDINKFPIYNKNACFLDNNTIMLACMNQSTQEGKIVVANKTGLIEADMPYNVENISDLTYFSDDNSCAVLFRNTGNNKLEYMEIESEFDNLFESNPILTEPYEKFISEATILDGNGMTISELKSRLFDICCNIKDDRVATRCLLIYAFKEFEQILSPYIDRNVVLSTRTKALRSPYVNEIDEIYQKFTLSRYSKISPVIESQLMTKKTPQTTLSMLCAFVAWRYIYEFNRSVKQQFTI
ncbi:MAG: hypothetical protein ABIM30_00145 [candidate division WOR-3 bacterium]